MPPLRPDWVARPRLLAKLQTKPHTKLMLVSAPAGYGKTTLVTTWLRQQEDVAICWLSLDEDESDPQQFFRYLAEAIRPLPGSQSQLSQLLQANQPIPAKTMMKAFVHDVVPAAEPFILVLDDYHALDSPDVDDALATLLDLMPPQMTLVLTSRSDPGFPISRLRARGQLIELRADDLRFTEMEAAEFLQQTMGLTLQPEQIAALENRTEGWIAGLQMAALSMQNRASGDLDQFVNNFTGSHRFVLDYLLEEVLHQQPENVQEFLLKTAVLSQLTGSLCDALTGDDNGQEILESLDRANLFLVPLDNERRWYRYHHLFAELLQQRHQQGPEEFDLPELHIRASIWYEDNGLELDAFHHAAAANDIERTERLIEGEGIPLHFRGLGLPVLHWLESLPTTLLDARPSLWVTYASVLLFIGQHTAVEQKLQAAEACLQDARSNDGTKDLAGRIASMRATLAVIQNDVETIIAEALRAQENLHPDNLIYRISATFALGTAYMFQGNKTAASQAFVEIISSGENSIYAIAATINMGQIQETNNQLNLAAKTYESGLHLAGDPPPPITCEGFLGLARIHYEWNDLDTAEQYGQQCFQMTQQMENVDSFASYGVFLSHLMLARGDVSSAVTVLEEAEAFVHQNNFEFRMPTVAAAQVLTLLRGGDLEKATQLAEMHDLPLSKARVHLAAGNASAALALLEKSRQQTKDLSDEQLKTIILQAIAFQEHGDTDKAVEHLGVALTLAEPGGFIRIFVDEGLPMARLLSEAGTRGIMPNYCGKLLAVFEAEGQKIEHEPDPPPAQSVIDPLTNRELEILTLIAAGQKNKEIAEQLVISLNTVLYHIKNIYSKLGVNKRTLAITKAKELNLI
ncbi:MAG: AAA family ATPase [Ardenticatenaceae bacterium]|nr:AAA family ATPase [Ardenticatenaceae bacterium]